jgi:N-acetyl-gamma-glutamyl-phosphate reductase
VVERLKAAVVGATGYTGAEVCRLLANHPFVDLAVATSERQEGTPLSAANPWLTSEVVLSKFDVARVEADVVFLCQPNGVAMRVVPELAQRAKVVDLSADFRLRDTALYPTWYGFEHACPEYDPWPVFGLPELVDRCEIATAQVVANPGCYVTATLLALVPLVREGLVNGTPIVDAKSGVSGAGRSALEGDHMLAELHGSFKPYKTTGHRHTPEMEQMLGAPVRFTPHLLPVSRGICATIHVPTEATKGQIYEAWLSAYSDEPFVRTVGDPPSIKQVHGSNSCLLFADVDQRTGHAVLVSVIDNLVKGAAGQAVQNMNIMLGLPETAGLTTEGVWP